MPMLSLLGISGPVCMSASHLHICGVFWRGCCSNAPLAWIQKALETQPCSTNSIKQSKRKLEDCETVAGAKAWRRSSLLRHCLSSRWLMTEKGYLHGCGGVPVKRLCLRLLTGLAAGAPLRPLCAARAHQRARPGALHRQGLARQPLHAGAHAS